MIFDMSIDGKGPEQIARILEEKQILTAKALYAKQKKKPLPEKDRIIGLVNLWLAFWNGRSTPAAPSISRPIPSLTS